MYVDKAKKLADMAVKEQAGGHTVVLKVERTLNPNP